MDPPKRTYSQAKLQLILSKEGEPGRDAQKRELRGQNPIPIKRPRHQVTTVAEVMLDEEEEDEKEGQDSEDSWIDGDVTAKPDYATAFGFGDEEQADAGLMIIDQLAAPSVPDTLTVLEDEDSSSQVKENIDDHRKTKPSSQDLIMTKDETKLEAESLIYKIEKQ